MNRIMADEPTLKTDVVTLDQEVKAMTFVSTPKITPVAAASTSNNVYQGVRPKTKNPNYQKKKATMDNFCLYCNAEGHHTYDCLHFPSVTEKKSALNANGRCEDCRARKSADHYCILPHLCKSCNGKHRQQLCENRRNNQQNKDR